MSKHNFFSNALYKGVSLFSPGTLVSSTTKTGCHHIAEIYLDTLTKFKKAIRKEQSDNTKRIPKHFYYGPRKLNIILT